MRRRRCVVVVPVDGRIRTLLVFRPTSDGPICKTTMDRISLDADLIAWYEWFIDLKKFSFFDPFTFPTRAERVIHLAWLEDNVI